MENKQPGYGTPDAPTRTENHTAKTKRVLCIGAEALGVAANRDEFMVSGYHNPFPPVPVPGDVTPSFPFPEHSTIGEALQSGGHDLALLSVPNHTRNLVTLEKEILQSGLSIACTKLRLANWRDAATLSETARSSSTRYYCDDHYHRSPTFQTARTLLPRIGEVQTVRYRCRLPVAETGFNPWTRAYEHLVLEDLAYHHFSVLAFFFGNPGIADAWCRSRCCAADGRTRNAVEYVASMIPGWTLNYSARWGSTDPRKTSLQGEITIEGSSGTLFVSKESLRINGQALAPEELLPRADWVSQFLNPPAEGEQPRCLTTLEEFLPVANFIQTGLDLSRNHSR